MQKNPLFQIWDKHQVALNGFLSIPSAWTAELMSHTGYDALTIDMQHGLIDYQVALSILQAISTTHTVPLVRLQWNEPSMIMKMLDAGAMGLICPMIETAEDTRQFIKACRYPPDGNRSYGPVRAKLVMGDQYFKRSGNLVLKFAMIETAAAAENLEEIAAVQGLDGLFIGPYDLSVSLGIEQIANIEDPTLRATIDRVLQLCEKNDLIAGVFTGSLENAITLAKIGFKLVSHAYDSNLLKEMASSRVNILRSAIQKVE
jgi:4-hydroxy-2-oxoheptanedioate aldolase